MNLLIDTLKPQSQIIVQDMMSTNLITVSPEMTMAEVKEIMRLKSISGMPVVDKQKRLLGIVSIADVIQALDDRSLDAQVKDKMAVKVHTVKPQDSVNLALSLFRRYQHGRLPVVDQDNTVVGIITPNDIVKRLACYLQLDEIREENSPNDQIQLEQSRVLEFVIKGGDFDKAGFAASNLKKTLQEIGVSPQIIRRAAIAAYEAEMNIVIHADEGTFKAIITADKVILKINDTGPGIKDIEQAMQIGYSTASDQIREMGFGAGMGLPNIKKSSDFFKIESEPQKGTNLYIEIFF